MINFLFLFLVLPVLLVTGVLYAMHRWGTNRTNTRSAAGLFESPAARAARWVAAPCRRVAAWIRDHLSKDGAGPAGQPGLVAVPDRRSPDNAFPRVRSNVPSPNLAGLPDDQVHPDEQQGVANAPVAEPWQAVAAFLSNFDPETDAEHIVFMQGNARGFLLIADGFHAYAETLLNSVGLDPAAVQGTVELAEVVADCSHDVTLALRRFMVVYQKVMEAVSDGTVLPHNARDWLTGEAS
jgi:hypothetical protein